VLRRLDDFVDRALGFEEIRRVEEHLADCVACAETARFRVLADRRDSRTAPAHRGAVRLAGIDTDPSDHRDTSG